MLQNVKKIRSLDLHGKGLDEANQIIETFIKESYEDKIQKLVIVTGKGLHSQNEKDPYVSKELGILKNSVPEFIKNNDKLMSMISDIQSANIEDGGSGAFYIFLKKRYDCLVKFIPQKWKYFIKRNIIYLSFFK